ncbi:MAG: hypothetical protein CVU13_09545 [Bacteroidetes bacterium HGW-Bacteroidetes-8]|nr:MAG: hypothetical protein CVU13_09545 [Bacteroidetes bacterium HGW-Bacteroidetes-8]
MIRRNIRYSIRKRTTILWICVLGMTIASFMEFSSTGSMDREVSNLESRIHKRQKLLEEFAVKTIKHPIDQFLSFEEELPEDMVIYRYFDNTLHSWANQLPISNDDIDLFTFGYTLNHLNSTVVTNTPLAYLGVTEQYVSLGSAWYIVNIYSKNNQTVITALLVQTDYPTENTILNNKINPNFSLRRQFSIVPVTFDESYIVHGKDGGVLFSVIKNLPVKSSQAGIVLRWFAILFAIAALFSNLQYKRGVKEFFSIAAGLVIIRLVALYQSRQMQGEMEIFSPNLYADFGLFNSLADLLINNVLIYLLLMALFMVRRSIALAVMKTSSSKRALLSGVFFLIPLLLLPYIHFSIRSLILNSNIVMELYKIDGISIYTFLVYISYGLLFMALLFSLQLLRPFLRRERRYSFFNKKPLSLFITLISLYTLFTVSIYGYNKEFNRNRVWTTKMSVERDLNMELQLKGLEKNIVNDQIIAMLGSTMMISDILDLNAPQVHCNTFFDRELYLYGMQLGDNSRFFFMNNYNGRISYMGVFTYISFGEEVRLYIELDSKFLRESIGYPDLLLDHKKIENYNLPSGYSFAKYLNNRLVTYSGEYNYPITTQKEHEPGYRVEKRDGYIHFVNNISPENLIIISRQERNIFPYVVSFSYLMLFFSFMILSLIGVRQKSYLLSIPRNSFRWKISVLIISSLVFALLAMGAGSIWFSVRYFEENNREQMEEKISSVQNTLSGYSKFAQRYNDPQFNSYKLMEAMNSLSNSAQIDINVYRSDGLLLKTTRSEIFDRYLLGYRMNPQAYKEIVFNNKKQFVNKEKIGDLTYYSLYAPLFNLDGNLIAILNIPYFSRQSDFRKDASSIIAAIINIYLLLLLAAVFGGVALSNSISKPLAEISRKMELLDISQQPEHINYTNRDELGILVVAYNKMVDDVNESTRRLAAGEREQAWREMARQIAHEIKNPLTPMRLSIQHLMRLKEQGVKDWPNRFDSLANSLIEQIDILSDAAGEFSSFSRFYSEELTRFDLNTLIREQLILFNTRDNIVLSLESSAKDAFVIARRTQLTRVFVNLFSNAVQAVEQQEDGGSIIITVERGVDYYEVKVEDDGPGVPESLTHRLFKPNFTTKSGGTGLGLAICRSIMEQSQGSIYYEKSQKLRGASFVVRIPV